jgi:IPT/TIG domain
MSGHTLLVPFRCCTHHAVLDAPASGLITTWRVAGAGELNLRVLRPAGEEEDELVAEGTSAPATNLNGGPNATSLPIRAGDAIGVNSDGNEVGAKNVLTQSAVLFEWAPALTDEGAVQKPVFAEPFRSTELLLNADIVLAPDVSSVAPASGGAAGGTAVTIVGKYLDGATGVSFGSTPASSFSVDSPSQITAIAPASAAATVDVRVTGPGGSSEVSPVDRYTFTTPATTANTIGVGGPAVKPTITGFSESSSRWRRGHSLPHISSAAGAPVGTTFSFSLNEPASVNLTFTQSVQGRRVARRCVAPGHRNAGRPRCKRTLLVGSFVVSGHAGPDKVGFQGRLSGTKTLRPGSYLVSLTAREAHGLKVVSRSLSFTILS